MPRRLPRVRVIEFVRAGWGAALLIAPRQVMTCFHQVDVDRRSLVIARILGGRQLSQAVLSGFEPSPEILALGVWVDTVHAGSALALAAADLPRARAGLTDALIALSWAGFGYHELSTDPPPVGTHDRRRDAAARWTLAHLPAGHFLNRRAAATARADACLPEIRGGAHDGAEVT